MPRKSREFSGSNVYHVIFRGNDKQDIFYDNQDRFVFLDYLEYAKQKFYLDIYSYCLMSNHIHIVIKVDKSVFSKAMQSIAVKYSMYFNKKYERRGHVFENRFVSKNVEDEGYFIRVCKYVHRNPEKAGIAKTQDYKWSSFHEYVNKEKIIDKKVLLHYFNGNIKDLAFFTLNNDDVAEMDYMAEYELINKLNDEELAYIVKNKFNLENASDVSLLSKCEKEKIIKNIKLIQGTSFAQISRVTKVNRKHISKV